MKWGPGVLLVASGSHTVAVGPLQGQADETQDIFFLPSSGLLAAKFPSFYMDPSARRRVTVATSHDLGLST